MIQLTPLDKTVAGQELIQIGIEKGRMEGLLEGEEKAKKTEIIGIAQSPIRRKKLLEQSPGELRAILKKLEAELKSV